MNGAWGNFSGDRLTFRKMTPCVGANTERSFMSGISEILAVVTIIKYLTGQVAEDRVEKRP